MILSQKKLCQQELATTKLDYLLSVVQESSCVLSLPHFVSRGSSAYPLTRELNIISHLHRGQIEEFFKIEQQTIDYLIISYS